MHHNDLARAIPVRVRIFLGRAPVGRPASMADAVSSLERLQPDSFFQVAQLAFGAPDLQLVSVARDGDACRIVASILQSPEPFKDDGNYRFFTDVANNAA